MVKPVPVIPGEQHFILSSVSPSRAQKRLALGLVLALLVAWLITDGALSTIQLGRIDAFVPAYAAAMFVIAYALLRDTDPAKRLWRRSAAAAILSSVALTATVVCAATFIVTAGDALLPRINLDPLHFSTVRLYIAGCLVLLSVVAVIALWIRRRSVLDLWLMVVMSAYVIEICMIAFPIPARFSFGWYAGRVFGLLSGSLLLFVLLYEITILYARLITGDAVSASIAHEIKQPLSGMITGADAGFRWLDRTTPDLDEAKAAFKQIIHAGHRAGAVIDGIRAIFKKDARNRTSLDMNELIGDALALAGAELQKHRVSVQAEPNEQLPRVKGDRVQVQQVLLNLITNAIDSMAAKDGSRVLCVRSEVHDGGG